MGSNTGSWRREHLSEGLYGSSLIHQFSICHRIATVWQLFNFETLFVSLISLSPKAFDNFPYFAVFKKVLKNVTFWSSQKFWNDNLIAFKWAIHGLFFFYFRPFNTVDSKRSFQILPMTSMDSNCGSLVSEATALSTEQQPLPIN